MRYFPVFVDLAGAKAVVVGGGEEALRKIRLLLKTRVAIVLVAAELPAELHNNPNVTLETTPYSAAMLGGASLVFSADEHLNAVVSADAKARNIPVNAVDDAALSTFIVPSIVDRDPVVVAIGTEGTAPVLGQMIRAKVDALLPQNLGKLAVKASGLRDWLATIVSVNAQRRAFWWSFFAGASGRDIDLADPVAFHLETQDLAHAHAGAPQGQVDFISVGTLDVELLTLKTQRLMMEADVIITDGRVHPAFLETARRDATRFVCELPAGDLLLARVNRGQRVVRLVGGDVHGLKLASQEQKTLKHHGKARIYFHAVGEPAPLPQPIAELVPFPVRDDIRDAILKAAS